MSISTEIIPRAIPGLPSREVLAVLCSAHSYEHHKQNRVGISHFIYRPTKRRGLFKKRGTSEPLALIKFGTHVTLGEARTQIYVFQHLKRDPSPPFRVAEVYDAWEERVGGFIVMEYIPGLAATAMDGPRIAAAIHWLLALPPPDDGKLGPVGGGPMRHSLWRDDEGPTYESVEQMDTHLNNVLKYQGLTVNLSADPICFYHDDIDLRNFLVAGDHLYVIDFEHTGFAPASFMSYSLVNPRSGSMPIIPHIKFPKSSNIPGFGRATYFFKITSNNRLGRCEDPLNLIGNLTSVGWNKPVRL